MDALDKVFASALVVWVILAAAFWGAVIYVALRVLAHFGIL